MFKKGELTTKQIVALIILIVSFLVILYFILINLHRLNSKASYLKNYVRQNHPKENWIGMTSSVFQKRSGGHKIPKKLSKHQLVVPEVVAH